VDGSVSWYVNENRHDPNRWEYKTEFAIMRMIRSVELSLSYTGKPRLAQFDKTTKRPRPRLHLRLFWNATSCLTLPWLSSSRYLVKCRKLHGLLRPTSTVPFSTWSVLSIRRTIFGTTVAPLSLLRQQVLSLRHD
jgi:hypothetical protein